MNTTLLNDVIQDIKYELARALKHGEQFSSMHEAYGVILEEVDEFWELTRLKKRDRKAEDIHDELVQISAMAIKGLLSIEHFVGGNI